MTYAWIILGAIAGAPLRYVVQSHVQDWSGPGFPWGTLAVNLSGCVAFGLLATLAEDRGWLGREGRLLLLSGFLGSYTTFSTFGWETLELLRDDRVARAMAYAGASAVLGVAGTWLGSVAAGRTGA